MRNSWNAFHFENENANKMNIKGFYQSYETFLKCRESTHPLLYSTSLLVDYTLCSRVESKVYTGNCIRHILDLFPLFPSYFTHLRTLRFEQEMILVHLKNVFCNLQFVLPNQFPNSGPKSRKELEWRNTQRFENSAILCHSDSRRKILSISHSKRKTTEQIRKHFCKNSPIPYC